MLGHFKSYLSRFIPWSLLVLAAFFMAAAGSRAQELFFDTDLEQGPSAPAANNSKTESKSQPEQAKSDEESKSVKPTEPENKTPEQPVKTDETSAKSDTPEKSSNGEKSSDHPKSEDTSKPVVRSGKQVKSPNPEELKVLPDAEGNVSFNFNGQPWLPVLQWLAKISGKSLDWQEKELPTDTLSLNTQSSYTVPEARDLINRYLLMRGYTLLCQGDILTVVNIKKIDPSLVPRVDPQDLDKHDPHEFVKVCFPLDWMLAETAVTELKPFTSTYGKLTALKTTNRLEAMDAVANLRDIWELLKDEQSDKGKNQLMREFRLKYARASEVCDQLQTLLGMESSSDQSNQSQDSSNNQPGDIPGGFPGQGGFMGRMMQMMGGPGGGDRGGDRGGRFNRFNQQQNTLSRTKPTDYTLVVNPRMNSILAHATPDKMAIIAQAIEVIDVPMENNFSIITSLNRMQVYRLSGIDPDPVVKTLEEIGNLDPGTRLQVDAKNKAIIAYASLADQVTIRTVISRLNGKERSFEVIPLRRLEADYVAGSIEFMMGAESSNKNNQTTQSNRNPFFGFGGRGGFQQAPITSSTDQKPDEFRVSADVEHNRLLVWANDVELSEVKNLLVKLGELPPQGSRLDTIRVIDAYDVKEGEELLDHIRRAWPSMSPNPLKVNPPPGREKPSGKPLEEKGTLKDTSSKSAAAINSQANPFKLVQYRPEEKNAAQPDGNSAPRNGNNSAEQQPLPPVVVNLDPDGRITITSDDPDALALFEDLMMQYAPPRKNYEVFKMKYALAFGVAQNLETFFTDEEKNQNQSPFRRNPFFNPFAQDTQTDKGTSLSKRRPLKFIPDSDSNSIMVLNADPSQVKTIRELINLYDQPIPTDSQSVRKTETVHLEYSKASVVAETVKEVYRDLLSTNDKSLQAGGGGPNTRMPNFMYLLSSEGDNTGQKAPKFKGLLSIGVDELSNSLVVSAPAFLFDQVEQMIKELDDAAAPTSTIKVVKLGQGVSGDKTKEVLSALLGQVESGSYRQQGQFQQNQRFRQPGMQQGQQGRGNRSFAQQGQGNRSQGNRGQGGGGGRTGGGGRGG